MDINKLYIVDAKLNKSVDRLEHQNQIEMLHCLYTGLRSIYDICKAKENEVAEKYQGINQCQGYKEMCEGKVEPEFFDMLPCYHHWFSVSVINYARLAGFLVGIADGIFSKHDQKTKDGKRKIKELCDAYIKEDLEELLSDILEYRNIISAHFALTDPRKDNFLTMDISAKNICGFRDNRIVSKAGAHVSIEIKEEVALTGQQVARPVTQVTTAEEIPIWSITQTFEELLPRYWPHVVLPEDKYPLKKIARREKFNFTGPTQMTQNITGKSRIVKPNYYKFC